MEPILLKKIAPKAFQKIPTEKKVKLTALRKSISKYLIKEIVTNKPVPEEIEPLRIPMKKISITKLNFNLKLILYSEEFCPKLVLKKEYNDKNIENNPKIRYKNFSGRNFTIDAPKITPGVPKNIN